MNEGCMCKKSSAGWDEASCRDALYVREIIAGVSEKTGEA